MDEVIEPSEIIIESTRKEKKETLSHVNPWIRCIARFFDYSLFFLLLLSSRKFFQGHLPFGNYEHLVPFEFFLWIPIETLLLATLGTTPGKFFLKTTLRQGRKNKLSFGSAIKRSFSVWIRGLGLGIPFLNFMCLLMAYNKLKVFKITSWDREDHIVVTHHPIKRWRLYVAVFVAVSGILYYYSEKNVELKHVTNRVFRSVHESSVSYILPT
jgi:hypothetical protein